jgi:hypothetical protein
LFADRTFVCDAQQLFRRMKPQTLQELKSALLSAWSLIPQDTIDRLCKGFQAKLHLCLVNQGESLSNQPWQVTERYALKSFFETNAVHVPWTQEEDERLLVGYLVVGPRWTVLVRTWETHSAVQLKNGWYHALRHRVYRGTVHYALSFGVNSPASMLSHFTCARVAEPVNSHGTARKNSPAQ